MNIPDVAGVVLMIVAALILSRAIPVHGVRRRTALGLRILGLICLWWALQGFFVVREANRPRHVVYLVDQSGSIDPEQTQWLARRVASLEAVRPDQVRRTGLAFGEGTHLIASPSVAPLTDPVDVIDALASVPMSQGATNLEAALLSGLTERPTQDGGRVVLFSDGRQTTGDVDRTLGHLRRLGLEVYPVPVPAATPTHLTWEQFAVPTVVQRGSSIPITVAFSNGTGKPQPVEVTVSLQVRPGTETRNVDASRSSTGLPLARKRARVPPGWHVVTMSVPALEAGTMALDVSVATAVSEHAQRRTAFVEVAGPPRVLVVLDRPTELPLLATALRRREIDLAVTTPGEFPREPGALLDYEAVILFQVPKSSFTDVQVEALEQYVGRFGGGLVMVGLGGQLDEEIAQDAPLDRLLPVMFEPKGVQEATRRVCLLMLIDRSASMMGPRIAATKRAAVEMVKQLDAEDLVSVLAFDTVPYVIVEVQQAGRVRSVLIDKLVRLRSIGGTNIYPALKAAQQRLQLTGATVKHVILLSDGNSPFDAKAYRSLLAEFTKQQITISTIAIGSAFVRADLLDYLATATGGTFYPLGNFEDLPQVVARDTEDVMGRLPFSEGYFQPTPAETSTWFEDIPRWPTLKGYLTATAKPEAIVELELSRGEGDSADPLLAHWAVGRGHVTMFTSDADTRWSPEWIRWHRFEGVWANVIRRTMRMDQSEQVFTWLEEHDGSRRLGLEGHVIEPDAELVSQEGRVIPLALIQVGRFRWEASLEHLESGWYQLIVAAQDSQETPAVADSLVPSEVEGSETTFTRRWIQIGHPTTDIEQRGLPPAEGLLRRIAQATGGMYDAPDAAFLPPTERVAHTTPLRNWLFPLVLLLLLADIALRGRTML